MDYTALRKRWDELILMIYRFLDSNYALLAIKERRLRISRISQLNDEFEFIGLALRWKDRRDLRKMKEHLGSKSGIISMSRDWQSPLLWAHYADNLRGIALGFEVTGPGFHPVEYRAVRPTLDDLGLRNLSDITPQQIKALMRMKFDAWSYEKEVRGFFDFDEGEKINGELHYFKSFEGALSLKRIIVGPRSPVSRLQVDDALGELRKDVEIFKARPAFKSFSIVRNRNEKRWQ